MSAKAIIYTIAALIILYLLFDPKGFGVGRIKAGVGWISGNFRKLWNPLIGASK